MKRLLISLLILTVLTSAVSCGLNASPSDAKTVDTMTDKAFDHLNVPADFPKSCYIQYDYTIGSSKQTALFAESEKGVYIMSGKEDILLLKADDTSGYLAYTKGSDGIFRLSDTSRRISRGYIDEYLTTFAEFCYAHKESKNAVKTAETTVCGRKCDQYTEKISAEGAEYQKTYDVDKETGVCLSFSFSGDDLYTTADYKFICTKFQTADIKLPQYE